MRALWILALVACASGPPYRISIRDQYEVGEDPLIGVAIRETREDNAVLIVTRPDGSTVEKKVTLAADHTTVRFGGDPERGEPTFTERGDYHVELRGSDHAVLATQEIRISVDRLTSMFEAAEVAGFRQIARYTRPRGTKQRRWKLYGAVYEHSLRAGVRVNVVIEEPGDALADAWKPYEEEGTLGVIEDNHVRFRERVGSVSASWISGKRIVSMRAATLEDLERGFIGHFLAYYPSKL